MKKTLFLFAALLMSQSLFAANTHKGALDYPSFEEALKEIKPKAEQGDPDAQVAYGNMFFNGHGVKWDHELALYWYKLAAAQGSGWAMSRLGAEASDIDASINWYKKAAEVGETSAFLHIALKYEDGKKDFRQALYWYEKSAKAGDIVSQLHLADIYRNGREDVAKNYSLFFYWSKEAAKSESRFAYFNLGLAYEEGLGVSQDYKEAYVWYLKASDVDARSWVKLGEFYRDGKEVKKDYLKAHMYFNLAGVILGDSAVDKRKALEKQMTIDEIMRAQELAKQFSASQGNKNGK